MIDNDEIFPDDEAKLCYQSFPADMNKETWEQHLASLVQLADAAYNGDEEALMDMSKDSLMFISATARKARDVVIWTLSDDKIPALLAALVECGPLLGAMHEQARQNIMKGKASDEAIRANGMLTRLDKALKAFQQ